MVGFTFGGHLVCLCFWDRSSLSCPGRPWIYNPSAVASWLSEVIHFCHQARLSLMPKFLSNTVLNPPIILIFVKCKVHYKGPVGISWCHCCDYAIERFLCLKLQLTICSKEDINSDGSLGGRGEAQLSLPRTQGIHEQSSGIKNLALVSDTIWPSWCTFIIVVDVACLGQCFITVKRHPWPWQLL